MGKARNEWGCSEKRAFAVASEADGDEKAEQRPSFMERSSCDSLLPGGLENSVPNSALSEGRGGSDLNWASPGASGLG